MASNPMQKKARTSFLLGVLVTVVILGAVIRFPILSNLYSKERRSRNRR